MKRLLIVDDERTILTALRYALEDLYEIDVADSAETAFEILEAHSVDLVLLDQRLGDVDGLDVIRTLHAKKPEIMIIAMTAYGSIESSIKAMQSGAYHYVTKPLDIQSLTVMINKALEFRSAGAGTGADSRLGSAGRPGGPSAGSEEPRMLIADSASMRYVFDVIDRVKDLDINVLITGESGTGKELIARAIHDRSNRAKHSFQALNCAAIPLNLLESELFGYEKGAFTGAHQKMKGKFELAHQGTIFLDEIGDLDLTLQAKLLRVIQEKKVTPLGSEKSIEVNFRLITATNRNLAEAVRKGLFRDDLFFRLNVVAIEVPPLRKRKEDIPLLCQHFLEIYSKRFGKVVSGISQAAIEALESYDFPGNVRELQNIIERAVALSMDPIIQLSDLPGDITGISVYKSSRELVPVYVGERLDEVERRLIEATLKHCEGNRRKTANLLGLSERHLYNKIKEFGLGEG
ncbi:sigma-54-dependent transcriptional regulator [Acidaminobacter hydrogenoformans]|uniref:Stage 0 sporulation protein A homolog n=1 Tax=Acidaminobacter hydrogenoformans DSM 2784 TaxID=1120920 RepID=A0A1G5RYV7_9FIRM|nr:sigma-54 dependent transcriptional regulator [Acidaminobacter hydrogenoformans]SCZ79028.1 regulatory protein, Fis family [Acidaminobacter hydrogenoformans DSM 2784]